MSGNYRGEISRDGSGCGFEFMEVLRRERENLPEMSIYLKERYFCQGPRKVMADDTATSFGSFFLNFSLSSLPQVWKGLKATVRSRVEEMVMRVGVEN